MCCFNGKLCSKLPDLFLNSRNISENIQNPLEMINYEQFNEAEKKSVPQAEAEIDMKNVKSLFTVYPEGDPRLVYRKFKSNTATGENRLFSGYLVNLQKLSKGKNASLTQYSSHSEFSQANNATYVKEDRSNLIFNSAFESGNLFAAYKVHHFIANTQI